MGDDRWAFLPRQRLSATGAKAHGRIVYPIILSKHWKLLALSTFQKWRHEAYLAGCDQMAILLAKEIFTTTHGLFLHILTVTTARTHFPAKEKTTLKRQFKDISTGTLGTAQHASEHSNRVQKPSLGPPEILEGQPWKQYHKIMLRSGSIILTSSSHGRSRELPSKSTIFSRATLVPFRNFGAANSS